MVNAAPHRSRVSPLYGWRPHVVTLTEHGECQLRNARQRFRGLLRSPIPSACSGRSKLDQMRRCGRNTLLHAIPPRPSQRCIRTSSPKSRLTSELFGVVTSHKYRRASEGFPSNSRISDARDRQGGPHIFMRQAAAIEPFFDYPEASRASSGFLSSLFARDGPSACVAADGASDAL